jgi:hypothetical protein
VGTALGEAGEVVTTARDPLGDDHCVNKAKAPTVEPGLSMASANCSAEEAFCIDHAGGRQQPKGDQCKLHDRPP